MRYCGIYIAGFHSWFKQDSVQQTEQFRTIQSLLVLERKNDLMLQTPSFGTCSHKVRLLFRAQILDC